MSHFEGDLRATDGARFAILASRWNPRITDALVAGARKAFIDNGVVEDVVDVIRVPGAWEIPVAAARIAAAGTHVAIVALGCVIRGATPHFDYVAGQCAAGLARMSLELSLPVAFGVLTTDSIEQAVERAGTKAGNKGADAAMTALEMVTLLAKLG